MALTDRQVRQARKPGDLTDGEGLLLRVSVRDDADGSIRKSWVLRVQVKGGRRVEMGLGSAGAVSLADVREQARRYRNLARQGVDPIRHREAEQAAAAAEALRAMTFKQCAEAYLAAHETGLKNAKHRLQWRNTLASTYEKLGALRVSEVDVSAVMRVLDPLWRKKTETASRIRGRIEAVLAWATVMGYREGANPAAWRNNLDKLLPARTKVRPVVHHPALPYVDIPAFMSAIKAIEGMGARALEFAILTAARSGEVRRVTWGEIDFNAKVWTVPGTRMKMQREHRVPLSDAALAVLKALRAVDQHAKIDTFVFPGSPIGRAARSETLPPISDMTLTAVLRRMKRDAVTVHGFRSTFRDWAAELTEFQREVAEAALAHVVGDKVEAAYRRGDLFEKRRMLMDAWAAYCASASKAADVVNLGERRSKRRIQPRARRRELQNKEARRINPHACSSVKAEPT
jgi:integrase